MKWDKYPSGAKGSFLQGALEVIVTQGKPRRGKPTWEAGVTLFPMGSGRLFPVQGAPTIDVAIERFTEWLRTQLVEDEIAPHPAIVTKQRLARDRKVREVAGKLRAYAEADRNSPRYQGPTHHKLERMATTLEDTCLD